MTNDFNSEIIYRLFTRIFATLLADFNESVTLQLRLSIWQILILFMGYFSWAWFDTSAVNKEVLRICHGVNKINVI